MKQQNVYPHSRKGAARTAPGDASRRGEDMRRAIDAIAQPAYLSDAKGRILAVNTAFSGLFGYSAHDMAGQPWRIFGPEAAALHQRMRRALVEDGSFREELEAYLSDGRRIRALLAAGLARTTRGEHTVAVLTDITEAKVAENLQAAVLEGMSRALDTSALLTLICREVERIVPGVRAAVRRANNDRQLCLCAAPSLPFEPGTSPCVPVDNTASPSARAAANGGTVTESGLSSGLALELAGLANNAEPRACLAKAIRGVDGKVLGSVTLYYDGPGRNPNANDGAAAVMARACGVVIEWNAARDAVNRLSCYDAPTGLPNRRQALAGAERLCAEVLRLPDGGSVAVLAIRLENLHRISQQYGFDTANEVLAILAQRLQDATAPGDLAGVLAEGEFILCAPHCPASGALETGKRVLAGLSGVCRTERHHIVPALNIGIALFPENGDTPEIVARRAGAALALAAQKGRNHIRFYGERPAPEALGALGALNTLDALDAGDSPSLESALYQVIENEGLSLHYQPQVYLRDGRLYGVEALCRWHDRERGMIPPETFIPLAEDCGLIGGISSWALREGCRQLQNWRLRAVPVPQVSINLSSYDFQNGRLVEYILACLREHGLTPEDLILELTERVLLDDDPLVMRAIHQAHSAGLRFSLDDFGTGYSSLSYLRTLPISELKLDQCFVRDLHVNDISCRLSRAVMHIGKSLNLTVLAEGVECREQYDLLKEQCCHVIQGYLVSRPTAPDALERWIEDRAPPLSAGRP